MISPNNDMILEMIEVPGAYYNYEVITSDGRKFHANKNIKHYYKPKVGCIDTV